MISSVFLPFSLFFTHASSFPREITYSSSKHITFITVIKRYIVPTQYVFDPKRLGQSSSRTRVMVSRRLYTSYDCLKGHYSSDPTSCVNFFPVFKSKQIEGGRIGTERTYTFFYRKTTNDKVRFNRLDSLPSSIFPVSSVSLCFIHLIGCLFR